MKLLKCKVLLPILCSLALLLSLFSMVMVSGSKTMPWREEDQPTELDKILERDGYLEGIMFPWFTHSALGHGFTSNELMTEYVGNSWNNVGMEQWGVAKIYREIYNLKALGFNIMGYEGSPYGEGVVYDDNGDVTGIEQEYLDNIRVFLDICREVGMPVAWTVTFHSTTLNDYYEDGKLAWDVIAQAYANPVIADHYAENFVKPLCDVLNEYQDVVVLMVSSVELENEINDTEIGNHFDQRYLYGVNQENMLYFINAVTEAVKEKMPNVPRTLAANTKDMTIYEGIDFDMLGVNNYNVNSRVPAIDDMKATLPMIGTEFGFGDGAQIEDEVWTIKQIRFRDNFISEGYIGWFYWCWSATGYGGVYDLLAADGKSQTDFRAGAFTIKYNADNYRAELRGEEITLDKPVLFCNTGSGTVEWISSRQAAYLTLERSLDGGKTWTVVPGMEKVSPMDYERNFKGSYIDQEIASCTTGGTVCYRITAEDDWGEIAVSEPNNVAEILGPPVNTVADYNPSFEDGLNHWIEWGTNTATSADGTGNYYAASIPFENAPDGERVLEIQYVDGEWFGIHIDGITVKPNTNYVITYQYMIADPVDYMTSYVFIRHYDPGNSKGEGNKLGDIHDASLTSKWMNAGSNSEWTTDEIAFKTNDSDKLGIDIRMIKDNHYYIDNFEMFEVR